MYKFIDKITLNVCKKIFFEKDINNFIFNI